MALVTPEMLAAVRAVGQSGLTTTVTIMRHSLIAGTDGDDDSEQWVDYGEYKAWIKQNDRGPVLHEDVGAMASIGRYRIHFKDTVELHEGDMIVDGSEEYIVNATNRGATYRVFTTAVARKRD